MTKFYDLKLRTKLLLGFLVILLVLLSSNVYSVNRMTNLDTDYTYVINYPVNRLNLITSVRNRMIEVRRLSQSGLIYANAGNFTSSDNFMNQAGKELENAYSFLQEYYNTWTNDTTLSVAQQNERIGRAQAVEKNIDIYKREVFEPIRDALRQRDAELATNLTMNQDAGTELADSLDNLVNTVLGTVNDISNETSSSATNAINLTIVIVLVVFVVAIMLVLWLSNVITKPIIQLLGVANNVAKGNLNVNINTTQKDEVGMLSRSFADVVENINTLITDINTMYSKHENGEMSSRINDSAYAGSYRDVATGVNTMVESYVAMIGEILEVLKSFAGGDFSKEIPQYKGEKANINKQMEQFSSTISSIIQEISDVLLKMSDGDLRVSIKREYSGQFSSIKESINSISSSLNKIMVDITASAEQVLTGSKQISSTAITLAEGASEQASSVEELTATIESINNQAQQNAINANSANELSSTTNKNAKTSRSEMTNMLEAMSKIKDSSNGISSIIKVISDIAFQTNLLALNAAVEAARAGEHGKGFAVVAEEVRNLASRSQASANDTAALIEESNSRVAKGTEIAQRTASSLNTIVDDISQVSEIIDAFNVSASQQKDAISQVNIGLEQISAVVQSNSSTSEESAAASEELTSQADMLQQLISFFKL